LNIHEYQAKEILKQFGVLVPKGIVIFGLKEIKKKIKNLSKIYEILHQLNKKNKQKEIEKEIYGVRFLTSHE